MAEEGRDETVVVGVFAAGRREGGREGGREGEREGGREAVIYFLILVYFLIPERCKASRSFFHPPTVRRLRYCAAEVINVQLCQ